MKKLSFYWRTNKPFDPKYVWQTPFGGAEISSLNLIRELTGDYDVWLFANAQDKYDSDNLHVRHYKDLNEIRHETFINVRLDPVINPREGRFRHYPERVIVWSGDAHDQSNNKQLWDKLVKDSIDLFVCKSEWQMRTLRDKFFMDDVDMKVMYNGVVEGYFDRPNTCKRPKFIHASVAFRGAKFLVDIFPRIKKEIPKAVINVITKVELYLGQHNHQFHQLYQQLGAVDGVHMIEPIHQGELARLMSRSYAMLYPCRYLESSCGTALESQAAGCPVITTKLAGLIETVGEDGILINGDAATKEYQDRFVEETLKLWTNKELRDTLAATGREKVLSQYTWRMVAQKWQDLLDSLAS
jgi:glycosyltransferase involved in cell wall biosynthesis